MTFTDLVIRIAVQLIVAFVTWEAVAMGLRLVNLPSDLAVFGGVVFIIASILFAVRSTYSIWRKR